MPVLHLSPPSVKWAHNSPDLTPQRMLCHPPAQAAAKRGWHLWIGCGSQEAPWSAVCSLGNAGCGWSGWWPQHCKTHPVWSVAEPRVFIGAAQIFICLQDKGNSRSFQDKLVGRGKGRHLSSQPVCQSVPWSQHLFIYFFGSVTKKCVCVCVLGGGCL